MNAFGQLIFSICMVVRTCSLTSSLDKGEEPTVPVPLSRKAGRGEDDKNKTIAAPITALALSADEKEIIVGSQNGIEVRSWPGLKPVRKLPTELSHVHDLAFSNDHKLLAVAGGRPGESGGIEIYRWPGGEVVAKCNPHKDVVYSIAWNETGDRVATASADGTVKVIEVPSGKIIKTIEGHSRPVTCVAWLPNNGGIITGSVDESVRVWNATTGESIRTLSNHTQPVLGLAVRPLKDAVPMVASIGADRTVRIWQPTIGRMVRFVKLASEPRAVAWSPEGKLIVTACIDGRVRVIDPESAEVRAELAGLPGVAHCLVVTREGVVIVGGAGGIIKDERLP